LFALWIRAPALIAEITTVTAGRPAMASSVANE